MVGTEIENISLTLSGLGLISSLVIFVFLGIKKNKIKIDKSH